MINYNSNKTNLIDNEFKWFGNYRAKVTEVDIEGGAYGAVRLFIPDLMTELDPDFDEDKMGLIAYPANNCMHGQLHVPLLKEYVWCFFECGTPSRPFYLNALQLRGTEAGSHGVPSESKSVPAEQHRVYSLLKTSTGRSIVACDSPTEERIEITGKRRGWYKYDPKEGMENDKDRTDDDYKKIDDNQTIIMLDEREGREKILIRTWKGDFIHFDIDQRALQLYTKGDMHIKSEGNMYLTAGKDIHLLGRSKVNIQSSGEMNLKSGANMNSESGATMNHKSGGSQNVQGAGVNLKGGVAIDGGLPDRHHGHPGAGGAGGAGMAIPASPLGYRDT